MTATFVLAGVSAILACGLFGVGFFRIALNIEGPAICWSCCAIGSVEIIGGAWIWTGLLAVMGGYL